MSEDKIPISENISFFFLQGCVKTGLKLFVVLVKGC